jgi:hypothetical protein
MLAEPRCGATLPRALSREPGSLDDALPMTAQSTPHRGALSTGSVTSRSAALIPALKTRAADLPSWLLIAFLVFEIGNQLALLVDSFAPLRVLVRSAAFIGSLTYLFVLQRKGSARHPSGGLAVLSLVVIGASTFHPDTNNAWAGLASVALHASIVAPLFWIPRLRMNERSVYLVFLLLWSFHSASAVVGALQAFFPGRFQPALSTNMADSPFVDGLEISLADGSRIFRPMGLTDFPGGAGMAASYSVLLGTGFLLDRRTKWAFRIVIVGIMGLGLVALYLTQVRSLVIMIAVSALAMGLPLARQRRTPQFFVLIATFCGIAIIAFLGAVALGGADVTDRFFTLVSEDPRAVYYKNRGLFLQYTIDTLLPQYPLGAGLGRWGMIGKYFGGGPGAPPPLWAEIQWTAWLFDGGILLMIIYTVMIVRALLLCLKIAARQDLAEPELGKWAAVLFGYGIGAFAVTFNSCIFESTGGIDFWILNAAVFTAATQGLRAEPVPEPRARGRPRLATA